MERSESLHESSSTHYSAIKTISYKWRHSGLIHTRLNKVCVIPVRPLLVLAQEVGLPHGAPAEVLAILYSVLAWLFFKARTQRGTISHLSICTDMYFALFKNHSRFSIRHSIILLVLHIPGLFCCECLNWLSSVLVGWLGCNGYLIHGTDLFDFRNFNILASFSRKRWAQVTGVIRFALVNAYELDNVQLSMTRPWENFYLKKIPHITIARFAVQFTLNSGTCRSDKYNKWPVQNGNFYISKHFNFEIRRIPNLVLLQVIFISKLTSGKSVFKICSHTFLKFCAVLLTGDLHEQHVLREYWGHIST